MRYLITSFMGTRAKGVWAEAVQSKLQLRVWKFVHLIHVLSYYVLVSTTCWGHNGLFVGAWIPIERSPVVLAIIGLMSESAPCRHVAQLTMDR
jgi:hypothetical protein